MRISLSAWADMPVLLATIARTFIAARDAIGCAQPVAFRGCWNRHRRHKQGRLVHVVLRRQQRVTPGNAAQLPVTETIRAFLAHNGRTKSSCTLNRTRWCHEKGRDSWRCSHADLYSNLALNRYILRNFYKILNEIRWIFFFINIFNIILYFTIFIFDIYILYDI